MTNKGVLSSSEDPEPHRFVASDAFLDSLFEKYSSEAPPNLLNSATFHKPEGKVVGDVDSLQQHWDGQQSLPDTCAIRCQEYLIEVYSGEEVDEYQLVQEAYDRGWYLPGAGTPIQHVGNLLDAHGIETHRYESSNIFHLADELGQGHKVIVGVDGRELVERMPLFHGLKDKLGLAKADHAVIVSGIDTTEPGNPQVIITDPGTGDAAARYPLEQFIEAWRDSDFTMITTTYPPPVENCPEMVNFGTDEYRNMLFRVAGMPYIEYLHNLWQSVDEPAPFPYGGSEIDAYASTSPAGYGRDALDYQTGRELDPSSSIFDLGSNVDVQGEDDGESVY